MPKKPAAKSKGPKLDIYQNVTDRMIAALEKGVRPWARPWSIDARGDATRPIRVNGKPYTGINVVLLWGEAMEKGYTNSMWMTFNQAKTLGGMVRKGEKGTLIVYASKFKKEVDDDKGGKKEAWIPFMKAYVVFNVEQIDSLPVRYAAKEPQPVTEEQRLQRIGHAEEFFAALGADIRHGGNAAFYSPTLDYIQVPSVDQFVDIESYYSTLGHESVHWTGHTSRLARQFSRFGSDAYAAEELVAELGAAFLCADLGVTLEPREDHAAYLQNWLTVLKGDKRFIVTAASAAQKAVELLKSFSGEAEAAEPAEENAEAGEDMALEVAA